MNPCHFFVPGPDWLEDTWKYRKNGYHPVEINDTFKDGRYVVLHKLGHGGFSTVWLAHDTQSELTQFVALKIISVEGSHDLNEIAVQRCLSRSGDSFDQSTVARLLDRFVFYGPNGRHTGLVFEMYGPSLNELVDQGFKIRPDLLRKLARQIVQIVMEFHNRDIAIGDLSLNNILLGIRYPPDCSAKRLYELIGYPKAMELHAASPSEPFPACGPKNQYNPVTISRILSLIEPRIALADLNDAMSTRDATVTLDPISINGRYAGPELAVGLERRHTKPLDIWALACVLFNMRSSSLLLEPGGFQGCQDLWDIQHLMGEVPVAIQEKVRALEDKWQKQWNESGQGEYAYLPVAFVSSDKLEPGCSLHERLRRIGTWSRFHSLTVDQKIRCVQETTSKWEREQYHTAYFDSDPYTKPPPARLCDEELADFEDLLNKMLRYIPEDRLTISDVSNHPWLNKDYDYLDDMTVHWISGFTSGLQYRHTEDWYEQVIVRGGTWPPEQQIRRPVDNTDPYNDGGVGCPIWEDIPESIQDEVRAHMQADHPGRDCPCNRGKLIKQPTTTVKADQNTVQCHNLEHVFVWRTVGRDTDEQLSSIAADHAADLSDQPASSNLNTVGSQNLHHIFINHEKVTQSRAGDHKSQPIITDPVNQPENNNVASSSNTIEAQNVHHVSVEKTKTANLETQNEEGGVMQIRPTITSKKERQRADPNTRQHHNLGHVFTGQARKVTPEHNRNESYIETSPGSEMATATTATITTETDIDTDTDFSEINIDILDQHDSLVKPTFKDEILELKMMGYTQAEIDLIWAVR